MKNNWMEWVALVIAWYLLFMYVNNVFGEELNSTVLKEGNCLELPANTVCYDPLAQEKIDQAQQNGMECFKKLKDAEEKILKLKKKAPCPQPPDPLNEIIIQNIEDQPVYKTRLFQISVGILMGFGIGFAIGAAN